MARIFNGTNDGGQATVDLSAYNSISVSFWLYWDAYANDDDMAMELGAPNLTNNGFYINPNSSLSGAPGNFEVAYGTGVSSRSRVWARPSAATWHHILVTINRSNTLMTLLVDGVLQTVLLTSGGNPGGNFTGQELNFMNRHLSSLFGAGRMAQAAIWGGVTFTAVEGLQLAAGVRPTDVVDGSAVPRYSSLIDSWRMAGNYSPEPNEMGPRPMLLSIAAGSPAGKVADPTQIPVEPIVFGTASPTKAPLNFTCTVTPVGTSAATYEFSPIEHSVKLTTAAIGGFGNCSFAVYGDQRRLFPPAATIRIYFGTFLVWEGRVEDWDLGPADQPSTTTINCFGFSRLLTDNTTRRIWSLRDLGWGEAPVGSGADLGGGFIKDTGLLVATGQFDPTDLSKFGVQVVGNLVAVSPSHANVADIFLPPGMTAARLMCDYALTGANVDSTHLSGVLIYTADGVTFTPAGINGTGSLNATVPSARLIRLGMYNNSGAPITATSTDLARYWNMRLLGTSLTEDAAGGYYGDTILKDLLSLLPVIPNAVGFPLPALGQGVIERGSDFTIPSLERRVRGTLKSVVDEVAGYYTREWAVWDGPNFHWTTPNLDEPQWIIEPQQLQPGTRLSGSIDDLAKTVYVTYTNALGSQETAVENEQSASSTDQRNPLVRAGMTKDRIVAAPTVMTDNTALLFAQVLAAQEVYPPVTGTLVLNATDLIRNTVGSNMPAAVMRAGANVYLPGMPRFDSAFAQRGRDGETLFHIVGTELDMETGLITLELEGQGRQIDVITARLAAATRVATG